jgi:hypothetical protein
MTRVGWISRWGGVLLLAIGLAAAPCLTAVAAPDAREIEAREDFAAGRYQQAVEIFARLYAETLRNIGRCYQNLGEADHAITSFREYLRKAKNMSPDEHAEIEGYIKEMQDLKRAQESAAAKPAASAAVATPPVAAAPVAAPPRLAAPPPAANAAPGRIDLVAKSPPPREEGPPPIYERWWFWAIVVGAVGAGVGVAAAAGVFTHTKDGNCPTGIPCGP